MPYTRANLLADAVAFLHRADLPVDVPADINFIDKANMRIGKDFRVQENALSLALTTLTPGAYALPTDFNEVIRIQAAGPGGTYALEPVSGSFESATSRAEAYPYGYWIRGLVLNVSPLNTADLNLEYYSAPALAAPGASTNPLLTNYPEAFLYYVLMLGNLYIQSPEQSATFAGLYGDILQKANDRYRQNRQPAATPLPNAVIACVAV